MHFFNNVLLNIFMYQQFHKKPCFMNCLILKVEAAEKSSSGNNYDSTIITMMIIEYIQIVRWKFF